MTPPSAMTMWPGLPGAAVDASGSASVRQGQICPVLIIAENKAPVLFREQNCECLSSAPSPQWSTLSQTSWLSMQIPESHWKPLLHPLFSASLKAVMISLKPCASVPHESVLYLRVRKLVRVKRTPSVPKVWMVFSHDKFALCAPMACEKTIHT